MMVNQILLRSPFLKMLEADTVGFQKGAFFFSAGSFVTRGKYSCDREEDHNVEAG